MDEQQQWVTPEARARDVVKNFDGNEYWIDVELAISDVAEAIRAAVQSERERCANACERVWEVYGYPEGEDTIRPLIRQCIADIRALD